MTLRITVELVPYGMESCNRKLCVLDVTNDGTGTHEIGNYTIEAQGVVQGGGWDAWREFPKRLEGFNRRNGYECLAAQAMQLLLKPEPCEQPCEQPCE